MTNQEQQSRDIAAAFFRSKSCSISATDGRYCPFDLVGATSAGTPIAVEVKARNVKHDAYPTMRVDALKKREADEWMASGYGGVFVASVYTDGFVCVGSMDNGVSATARAPYHTEATRGPTCYVTKDFWDVLPACTVASSSLVEYIVEGC